MSIIGKIAKGASKHMSDLATKKSAKQRMTEEATKGQRTYREGQRKAGGAGAATGAVATAATTAKYESDKKEAKAKESKGKGNDTRTKATDFPTYKKGTESSKAFNEAFKKAKDAGKKTFTFEGRSYKVEDKKEMAKGGAVKKMMYGGMSTKGKK